MPKRSIPFNDNEVQSKIHVGFKELATGCKGKEIMKLVYGEYSHKVLDYSVSSHRYIYWLWSRKHIRLACMAVCVCNSKSFLSCCYGKEIFIGINL